MRRNSVLVLCTVTAVFAFSSNKRAAASVAEPTMQQIYQVATSGHLDKAQQMITEVLANHPASAKAHWVQAELFAKEGKGNLARSEVLEAERLNPGLTEFSPKSVRELKAQLGLPIPTTDLSPVKPSKDRQSGQRAVETRIPLENLSGTLVAPVVINNAIKLNFLVDSGASDVSIPADVFSTLVRTNTLTQTDITGFRNYKNADGEVFRSNTFVIRSLRIGNVEVLNVHAKVAPTNAPLLLGQSFLKRFKTWSINNSTQELILER
jgi:clan AA aspartic protease (TIGR02281 family)